MNGDGKGKVWNDYSRGQNNEVKDGQEIISKRKHDVIKRYMPDRVPGEMQSG